MTPKEKAIIEFKKGNSIVLGNPNEEMLEKFIGQYIDIALRELAKEKDEEINQLKNEIRLVCLSLNDINLNNDTERIYQIARLLKIDNFRVEVRK